jgi:hypothetical protein
MIVVGQRVWMGAERKQEVQEREKEVTDMLEHGHGELSSREADLNTREAALGAEQKHMGELRADLLAHELTTDIQANHLAFREELADKEKQLAEKQLQELAAVRKRLEEL